MKRITAALLAMVMAMVSLQGCYGKMALTRKVYQVNGEVGDKYLRSLVTWVFIIVPVYGIAALVDFVLFNTIEFWSGHNPVAQGEKDFQYSENGDTFKVHAQKSGETLRYTFNRYHGDTYLDTLTIDWNVKTGNSVAALREGDNVTQFQAMRGKGGVKVTSSAPAALNGGAQMTALYQ
ncbi:DUF3332 domain-containing protein [Geomonas sp. Red69]|uniref:DUF3332 domain-containing protein n=1 Tax=Geomonas diazotrophica TaxID=2843197 RepID=A0ABX8JEM8_9BACT|nr:MULTISPECIES: DUF3332 domain-containing protein [Geomonas]MBU5635971.1 DUF3332 domain-containing protein [Geomonas diazotrophica]QWV96850.1 DUF3332 domain-containing protein [Geomonas nitrogeniifigens]QXE86015.1 DUF3332 domain-containing protein [Geomonas nitrogeniifigens]